jgi:hypothetical protein
MNNKNIAILLITAITASSLIIIGITSALTPAIPDFTVQYVDNSYYIPPTYGVDEFSGETVQKGGGFTVENKSIQVTIKNQPFTPYKNSEGEDIVLSYYVRYKGHYGDGWHYQNTIVDSASSKDTTTITFVLKDYMVLKGLSAGDKVDFEVQSKIGYYTFVPDPMRSGFYHEGTYEFTGESSAWSSTQTLTVPGATQSVVPSPTVPELPTASILLLLLLIPVVAVFIRRRNIPTKA